MINDKLITGRSDGQGTPQGEQTNCLMPKFHFFLRNLTLSTTSDIRKETMIVSRMKE